MNEAVNLADYLMPNGAPEDQEVPKAVQQDQQDAQKTETPATGNDAGEESYPENAVIAAKSGDYTIPYEKLVDARTKQDEYKAQADAATAETENLKARMADLLGDFSEESIARGHPHPRFVFMSSTNVFDRQSAEYRLKILGQHIQRIAIEAAHGDFWRKYVGLHGKVISIDTFGVSAPAGELFEHFGFTVWHVVDVVKGMVSTWP